MCVLPGAARQIESFIRFFPFLALAAERDRPSLLSLHQQGDHDGLALSTVSGASTHGHRECSSCGSGRYKFESPRTSK